MATRRRRERDAASSGREALALDREALKRLRLARGFTQQALAQQRAQLDGETVSISYAQIRRIEADGRAGPGTARILAALLGVDLQQLRPRAAGRGACGLPREPSVDFVGRQAQIEAVLQVLERQGSARIAASVEGLPGIGKTELALQVCARCERSGLYRIFWFDAQGGDLRSAWADTVAPFLGIEHGDPEQRAQRAIRAVESSAEPTLVVLDNLEHWSQTQPWPRPQGAHIRWLITTRVSRLGERAFEHVALPVLDSASARELVLRIAGAELAQRPGFEPLLANLDGYTIALELAAAFLGRFPEVSPEEYLKLLLENKRDVLEEEVADRTPYQITLDRALDLLWRRLSPSLQSAWVLAARFEQDRATHALSDACGLSRPLRAQLRDFHLIQGDAEGWSMHRLTRAFGRRVGSAEQQHSARQQFLRGCVARAELMDNHEGFRIYAPDRAHFEAALCAMEDSELEPGMLAEYLVGIAISHDSLGEWARARRLTEKALNLKTEQLGEDHEEVAAGRSNLANILSRQGELSAARDLHQKALESLRARLGEDHPGTATCRSNLALVLHELGELQQAAVLAEQALESDIRTFGEHHPTVPFRQSILALRVLALGDVSRAERLSEDALRVGLRVHGEDHPHAAWFRKVLARVLLDKGELLRARSLAEEALQGARRMLGEENPHFWDYQHQLSSVLHGLGELPRARALRESVLEAEALALGENHPDVLASRTYLAEILTDQGEFGPARELAEATLQANLRVRPPNHPQLAHARRVLARVLHACGEREAAQEQLREARRIACQQPEGARIRAQVESTAEELG